MVLCSNNDNKNKNIALFSIIKKLNSELEYLKQSFQNLNDENKLTLVPSLKELEKCLDIIEQVVFIDYNRIILDYIKTRNISQYNYLEIYKQALEEYNKRKGL